MKSNHFEWILYEKKNVSILCWFVLVPHKVGTGLDCPPTKKMSVKHWPAEDVEVASGWAKSKSIKSNLLRDPVVPFFFVFSPRNRPTW